MPCSAADRTDVWPAWVAVLLDLLRPLPQDCMWAYDEGGAAVVLYLVIGLGTLAFGAGEVACQHGKPI